MILLMRSDSGSPAVGTSSLLSPTRLTDRSRSWSRLSLSTESAISTACSSVIVPGEIELGKMAAQRRDGLRMPRELIELMQAHAARLSA